MKAYGVRTILNKLEVEEVEILKEGKLTYTLNGYMASQNYRTRIDKSQAHLSEKEALTAFIKDQREQIGRLKFEIWQREQWIYEALDKIQKG